MVVEMGNHTMMAKIMFLLDSKIIMRDIMSIIKKGY